MPPFSSYQSEMSPDKGNVAGGTCVVPGFFWIPWKVLCRDAILGPGTHTGKRRVLQLDPQFVANGSTSMVGNMQVVDNARPIPKAVQLTSGNVIIAVAVAMNCGYVLVGWG